VILCKLHPEARSGLPQPYTRSTMASGADDGQFNSYKLSWGSIAGIALFSVLYFADVFLKASRKCFWFDELFTTYLCRLPSFKATWTAVTHGADFNPPMLYLLTRGAQWLFGEGLIATRLPAMLGFWVFSVCLFLFVSRRAGPVSGFIAGMFPFFTLAQYYAYEARAHAIVLGWCGLTLVCWQRTGEARGKSKYVWLAGFGVCLIGALLTHVYAVFLIFPFALVEFYDLIRRRPNWGIIATMGSAFIVVVVFVYLPLFRMYRATVPLTFRGASHDLLERFLENTFGPAVSILLLSLLLFALDAMRPTGPANLRARIPKREMLAAAGLACIPLVALIGSKISHGPFIERYFLVSIAGYAIALGFASFRVQRESWTAKALAGCMLFLMIADLGTTAYLRNRLGLTEPSSGLALSTNPSRPLALYDTISEGKNGLDILVLPALDYLYLFRYAPPSVVSHLYFAAQRDDLFLAAYGRLASQTQLNFRASELGPFLATHDKFLVYEDRKFDQSDMLQTISSDGYGLQSVKTDAVGTAYEFAKLRSAQPNSSR
jgi:Dolichyl-phosphate-mannose-protein mannosyltransferase